MTSGYPLLLDLRGRRVVVVGGGGVAARKVGDLLETSAHITVISPALHHDLAALGDQIEVRLIAYEPGILAELRPLLVFATTDSPEANRQVAAEARELGFLVSVADDSVDGDFSSMAAVRRGSITLAVATDGASPALTAHLREKLEAAVGEEYTTLAGWLGELRPLIRGKATLEARRDLWQAIIASPALERLRAGDEAGARAIIDKLVAQFEANGIL
jgi:precorrin-2 dehydrogenase/sirohydrochlorin ferrochelatase